MDYTPDKWVVLKFPHENGTFYKVLGGWSGGYTWGDSWRMNSGITKAEVFEPYIEFYGYSGSKYLCDKNRYGLSIMTAGIVAKLEGKATVMLEDTDWSKIDWGL